jgi:hypothetical protein
VTKVNLNYKDPSASESYVHGVLQEPEIGVAIYFSAHQLAVEGSSASMSPDLVECFGRQAEYLRAELPRRLGAENLLVPD